MKKAQNIITLGLSIIAITLSAFAVYQVTSSAESEDSFKANVFDVIDAYVAEKSGQAQAPTEPVDVSIDDDAMKGDKDAPVTIVEFSDFECPFCGRYASDAYPQIVQNYIDTGKVNYVFRDFPLNFHQNAKPASNAAECVREQGGDDMYFAYHDTLFTNQGDLSIPKLKEYAAELDIDQEALATCIDSQKFYAEIDKDFQEGQSYGVKGTPAFFVNGTLMAGAQPYEAFEAAIEAALDAVE